MELRMNPKLKETLEWIYCILIALILALLVRYYIATPTIVKQPSMYPTLKQDQRLILNRLATSRKRYNENCLVKNKTDKNGNEYQEYSAYVLEAKLVVGEMVFSIESEFVENVNEKETKQDCETKAFKRLAEKIKKEYPKLKIIISGYALYANKPVLDICEKMDGNI